jgi:hypothetical protein
MRKIFESPERGPTGKTKKKSPAASGFANSITAKVFFMPYRSEPIGANGKGRSLPTYAPSVRKAESESFQRKTVTAQNAARRHMGLQK